MDQLNFFDIPFSAYPREELLSKSIEMIEEPRLHTMLFVPSSYCAALASVDEDLRKRESMHYIPGDYALGLFLSKRTNRDIGKYRLGEYLIGLCEEAVDREWEVCFLLENPGDYSDIAEHIRKQFPYIVLHDVCLDDENTPESVINEINSIAPDILIVGTHMAELLRYMEYDRQRTNAGFCVAIPNLTERVFDDKPKFFKERAKLRRLEQYYRKNYPWHIWA